MAAIHSGRGIIRESLKKLRFNFSGYNKYGLMYDDLYHDMHPVIKEAVRRLPQDLFYQRQHRHMRAISLSMKKMVLPDDQCVKMSDDIHYLKPYINEIMAEIKEVKDWNSR